MKRIASVIVDVPTAQTDRSFDYLIPDELKDNLEVGMRVIVPFGNRQVQGFVIAFKETSTVSGLKEIIEPMDIEPVLNQELLQLGEFLANETLCLKISAYQVMLPPALKAKYDKYITLAKDREIGELPKELEPLFLKQKKVNWKDAEKLVPSSYLYRQARAGLFDVSYEIKNKGNKKKNIYYVPFSDQAQFLNKLNQLNLTGKKQLQVVNIYLQNFAPHTVKEIETKVPNARSSLNQLVSKGLLKKKSMRNIVTLIKIKNFKKRKHCL